MVEDQGKEITQWTFLDVNRYEVCQKQCDDRGTCESFRYCENDANPSSTCYLFGKNLFGNESLVQKKGCYTSYLSCSFGMKSDNILIDYIIDNLTKYDWKINKYLITNRTR